MYDSAQKILQDITVEIVSSEPETTIVYHYASMVFIIIIAFAILILLIKLLSYCGSYFGSYYLCFIAPLLGLCLVLLGVAVLFDYTNLIQEEEPTGKMLYTIIVNDQTDMLTLQQYFDVIDNITYRTITVRIKDAPTLAPT